MKRYLFLISIFAISLTTAAEPIAKDSLKNILQSTSSAQQKLETLTNLMDITRQEEQLDYAKQLYREALATDNDYYKEAALTEILRNYVNNDVKDSANFYLAEAERELDGKARDYLVTYMKTVMNVRVFFYTKSEEGQKLIENALFKLETGKNLTDIEKMSINYQLAMQMGARVDPGKEAEMYKKICFHFKEVLALTDKEPLRYSYLFRLNPLHVLSLGSPTPEEQIKYTLQYLAIQKEYAASKEMKKRPYTNKRHLMNAYSVLAAATKTIGKDSATYYYKEFLNLIDQYPEDAQVSREYEYYITAINHFKSIGKYKRVIEFEDSLIGVYAAVPTFRGNIVLLLKEKVDAYDSLKMYKEAYLTYKDYVVLLDSARLQSMKDQLKDLEIQKNVNELVIEKKALEVELQKSQGQLYFFFALFLLVVCAAIYVFFRLGKIKSLYRDLQESNRLVILASEKAQESERMKSAFIKNMCHEVRTPLNAINGFSEMITSDGLSNEEKKEFSKIIFTNCNNLTSMMNDVLVIAQLDSSNETVPLEPVNINLLCQHEISQLKTIQLKPDIDYQIEGDKEKDLTYTNPTYFSLIIAHLLNNANKFTTKGHITLAYEQINDGEAMQIRVTDTGSGIPADKSEWIFERFTKSDDFIPGSGLGLYLCRLVVERLKGTIVVDTAYVQGARFVLTLPTAATS